MLSCVKIENFKSILKTSLQFTFSEGKAPNHFKESDFFIFLNSKKRCLPCVAILGANASGKSNSIQAIKVLQNILKYGINNQYFPNKLNRSYDATKFILEFEIDNNVYIYTIQYNFYEILLESLLKNNKPIYEATPNEQSFYFSFPEETKNTFQKSRFDSLDGKTFFRNTLLSRFKLLTPSFHKDILKAYDYISNIKVFSSNVPPFVCSLDLLQNMNDTSTSFNEMVKYIKKCDLNIERIEIEAGESQNRLDMVNNVFFFHKDNENAEVKFNITEESKGTQILFGIIGIILDSLRKGGTIIIDELDQSLHPVLIKEIIRLYKNKYTNISNAQLIYTTHDTSVLEDELIRVSDAIFLENSIQKGTIAKRICDFEGVTNADNFRRMYINNMFGANPIITI